MQGKGDLLPYGQTNRRLGKAALIEESAESPLGSGSCTSPCRIAGAECSVFLHEQLSCLTASFMDSPQYRVPS